MREKIKKNVWAEQICKVFFRAVARSMKQTAGKGKDTIVENLVGGFSGIVAYNIHLSFFSSILVALSLSSRLFFTLNVTKSQTFEIWRKISERRQEGRSRVIQPATCNILCVNSNVVVHLEIPPLFFFACIIYFPA